MLGKLNSLFEIQVVEDQLYLDCIDILRSHPTRFKKPKFAQLLKILSEKASMQKLEPVIARILPMLGQDEIVEILNDWVIHIHTYRVVMSCIPNVIT